MRIERSICPLTRWMFATILVRRRLWSFLERLNLSQYWTQPVTVPIAKKLGMIY